MRKPSRSSSASSARIGRARDLDARRARPSKRRADRRPRGDVPLDDAREDPALPLGERLAHVAFMVGELAPARPASRGAQASSEAVTPSPRKRPRAVSASVPPSRRARPSRSSRGERAGVERLLHLGEPERLVQAQPEHHPLERLHRRGELLLLARRRTTLRERDQVALERGRVAPAARAERADGADADPEVVAPEPDAEVVLRAQVAAGDAAAEVRGLVPAVAGAGQCLDDELDVSLHRLRLRGELGTVGVGEARPRLRLELVGGQVLRARAPAPRPGRPRARPRSGRGCRR